MYKQLNDKPKDTKRPDILFHVKSGDTIVEIGCGKVKKDDIGNIEAKARVLETTKRQIHVKTKFGKKYMRLKHLVSLLLVCH